MKISAFARRCSKELLRDPLSFFFGLGFPVVLLLLLSAIQANIPTELFAIGHLAPGVCVFGLSFITLFSATLVSRDRETAFLSRLYTTPMKSGDFILGYLLPLIPLSAGQSVVCYLVAIGLGLEVNVNILYALVLILPVSMFYICLGLLCGSILNVRQVGGICGALLTNISAWLSGVWFDLDLVGEGFRKAANLLPFVHAVELQRAAVAGNLPGILPHLWPVLFYTGFTAVAATWLFLQQMKK